MAQDKTKQVSQITDMEADFAQWFTDVCTKAELIDYSSIKGMFILRPYGYAIWENFQKILDEKFKETGHENVYLPMLIPESLLQKEKDHVEGFAPECAWVTYGGSEPLEERYCIRPTSETLFCEHYSHIIHSHRDLPKLYNQWCSVLRWEKTSRPFLRHREFLWQEGHTMHATAEEAIEETERMFNIYADFCENYLAMPVVKGRKTDKEKFSGAEAAASRHLPLLRRRLRPGLRGQLRRQGQPAAHPLRDLLGRVHPPHRRRHHDPRGQQRPGAAPPHRPHPGHRHPRGPAQGRGHRGQPGRVRPSEGRRGTGEDGRL